MTPSEIETIVTSAIQNKLVVEVDYLREEGGGRSCRLMEPFDVAPGKI